MRKYKAESTDEYLSIGWIHKEREGEIYIWKLLLI